jgi:holo-[acyl-carrier protein] synthase
VSRPPERDDLTHAVRTPRIGCDVVDVARLAGVLDRRPGLRARVFTDRELAGVRRGGVEAGSPVEVSRLAARWAAKEAARKALGDLRLPFHAVEVVTDPCGAPVLHLRGRPSSLSCSLSHDGGVAMAVVLAPQVPIPHPLREESAHAAG